jgi:hypothetical protein
VNKGRSEELEGTNQSTQLVKKENQIANMESEIDLQRFLNQSLIVDSTYS